MRVPLLVLVLCCGSGILCYSQGMGAAQDIPARGRDWFAQPRSVTNKLPDNWHVDFSQPFKMPQIETRKAAVWSQDSHIDSQCIVPPPQKSLGALSSAIPILQNQYPGLKIVPIDIAGAKLEAKVDAIPVQWPKLKRNAIPTNWPKLEPNFLQDKKLSSAGALSK